MKDQINIFWFRRDLRLFDNTGLYYALSSGMPVLPIFIFDPHILDDLDDKRDARVEFIHDQLLILKMEFEKVGSTLSVFHSSPIDTYKKLLDEYEVAEVYTNRDYEPYAISRDHEIETLLAENGSKLLTFKDHVIFEGREILTDGGSPYKVFTPYKNKWLAKLDQQVISEFKSETLLSHAFTCAPAPDLPLEELGFRSTAMKIPPIEYNQGIINRYAEQRNFPGIKGTTKLGIHFRFGTVSIRQAVKYARSWNQTWLNELIWREFYQMVLFNFPHVVNKAFKPQYDHIPWRDDPEQLAKWCDGQTGYPIVDAGMRELNTTGYMHNRIRMIVASFLTKHLLLDWRLGESYFAKKLLDFELASNNGGWQWAAGTGTDAQPYFRVFNPYSQTDKFDKRLTYIKQWVPEHANPSYPKPIVDHKFARQRAINTYKEALS